MPAEAKGGKHILEALHQKQGGRLHLPSWLGLGLVGPVENEVSANDHLGQRNEAGEKQARFERLSGASVTLGKPTGHLVNP